MKNLAIYNLVRQLNGRAYTTTGFRRAISKIRIALLEAGKFSPELGTSDLIQYIQKCKWVRLNPNNKFRKIIVQVPDR